MRYILELKPTVWTATGWPATLVLCPYGLIPLKSTETEQLDQLLAARGGLAQSLARLRQQRTTLPAAASVLTEAIKALEVQEQALTRQVAAQTEVAQLPGVAALDRVHDIGPITATAVSACLAAKEFSHPDQFVAYIGLDVRVGPCQRQRHLVHLDRRPPSHRRGLGP